MRLEDPFYRFARAYSTTTLPNAVTNDDLRMYCSGLTELCVVRTYLLTDAGIAAVAAGLRALYVDHGRSIDWRHLLRAHCVSTMATVTACWTPTWPTLAAART